MVSTRTYLELSVTLPATNKPSPPDEFNPTVFQTEGHGVITVWVECWGREVGRVEFRPDDRPGRHWGPVLVRWAKAVIDREYRKWREKAG